VTVAGINATDGKRMVLGKISIAPIGCSWTDRFLICPGPTGVEVWRFAN